VFRHVATTAPMRHLEAAALLGAEVRGAAEADAGAIVADHLIALMRAIAIPNGLIAVGYGDGDVPCLVDGAYPQRRLLDNAPSPMTREVLDALFRGAMAYW
jgi:hydroxyacid-oxoacid transhydrogenase